jgi:glycosyltransferase involved in cell wall biosynthesis
VTSFADLHVVLVGPVPPPAGGMAMQTRQMAELLAGEGARVTLVPVNAPYVPSFIGGIRGLRAAFRLVRYVVALWKGTKAADLVHVMANSGWSWHLFAVPALRVGRLRGVPVVVNYRGGEADAFLRRSAGSVRAALGSAARLIVPSGFLQGVFARHGMHAEVVPNVVDLERFAAASPAALATRSPVVFVARNLERIYDVGTAIRSFAIVRQAVPHARLAVAGRGPEEASLRSLAGDLGVADAVEFCGQLDRDTMAQRYRQARVVLNPSLVDNMPNSVLEAMASGVPNVSTDVGGVRFVLRDGVTGVLVPPRDHEAMARATIRLLQDDAFASRLAAAANADVQQYAWPRVRSLWHAVYAAARQGTRSSVVRTA